MLNFPNLLLYKKIPLFSRNIHQNCREKGFPGGTVVKNLPASSGDAREAGLIPGLEDPLEKKMAHHSSILAWRILWAEERGRLESMGSQRVGHT